MKVAAKPKHPQVRLDDATAARLGKHIAAVWKKTGERPKAREIVSKAVNAYLDTLR